MMEGSIESWVRWWSGKSLGFIYIVSPWSTHGRKSLASIGLDAGSLLSMLAAHDPSTAMKSVRGPEPLSYANPLPHLEKDIVQSSKITATKILIEDAATIKVNIHFSVGSPELGRSSSVSSMVGSSGTWQVAMGSQLRLRFEQEVRLLKKARSKIAKRDQRIQVLNLQAQVMGEENIKVAFQEFKKYKDDKVEQRYTKIDARLDKLSVDFDEELYSHMLTAIAGRRWVIGHGLHLAVMKYVESSEIRQAFADVVSVGLAKESDTREDSPQWIRDLRPSSSQLKILVYPEVHDPEDLWAVKEDMMLEDAIAANISWVEKKKKCRVVCRTHGIGSAHHIRSDGIPVFAPTAPQGLAILLADAATQTKAVDHKEPHPRL
uniref:Uncharacterized protein n=1 Tax=Tanacetum cinerariifolium TaxID=118510 RepID=A0A6L2MZJ6_TANCI|nr:hypothetical protein [Tanacetum cinerariifolium]